MPARHGHEAARRLGICLVFVLSGTLAAAPASGSAGAGSLATASPAVRMLAESVVDTGDNGRRPYIIIDKVNARVFVFDAAGRLRGSEAALLGMARGDDAAADIGSRALSEIGPSDRVTPAGRFPAWIDQDAKGREILLIDYDASVALHPVAAGTPAERRAERLASATTDDNRISFGCVNVPPRFYAEVVTPAFSTTRGVVYILPETAGWDGPMHAAQGLHADTGSATPD